MHDQPYLGTKDETVAKTSSATSASNLDQLHEEYKQYKLKRKKDEMQNKQEAGTPAYIISIEWLEKYHAFIMFDEFEQGVMRKQKNEFHIGSNRPKHVARPASEG